MAILGKPLSVYRATFNTDRGTARSYTGVTANPALREMTLQKPGPFQPAWAKAGCHNFKFKLVVSGIYEKVPALMMEALLAAKDVQAHPHTARGGPWCKVSLSAKDRAEVEALAACGTVEEATKVIDEIPHGSLATHLGDVKFVGKEANGDAQPATPSCQGVPDVLPTALLKKLVKHSQLVVRRRPSGHAVREQMGLQYGDDCFAAAKWGSHPAEAHSRHDQAWRLKRPAAAKSAPAAKKPKKSNDK